MKGRDGRNHPAAKPRRKRAADDWAPGLSESQRLILCRIGWQIDHGVRTGPGGTSLGVGAAATFTALAARKLITADGIYYNLTGDGRKMFATAPDAFIEEAMGGAGRMAELLRYRDMTKTRQKPADNAPETVQDPAEDEVAAPSHRRAHRAAGGRTEPPRPL